MVDIDGRFAILTAVLIGVGIGAVVGGLISGWFGNKVAVEKNVAEDDRWKYILGFALGGAVIGGIVGGVVGYGVGTVYGASAASGIAASGLAIDAINKAISAISKQTIDHIMPSKHLWASILDDATRENVKSLIYVALQRGTVSILSVQGAKTIYEVVWGDIVVRYALIDGLMRISDAWVMRK